VLIILRTSNASPIKVKEEAKNVEEAVQKITKIKPELVFMDIELQSGTGFDVLKSLEKMDFHLIFTRAFEHYAIKAIKFASLDYLLKPIDIEELQNAVRKAVNASENNSQQELLKNLMNNLSSPGESNKKISLATAEGIEFIPTDQIYFCEANGSYTNFHLKDSRKLVVSKNLKEYENMLLDSRFMRVHNSYLINLQEVKRFVKSEGGYIVMNNDAQISISNSKREEFLRQMGL